MAGALAQTRRSSEAEAKQSHAEGEVQEQAESVGVPAYLQLKCSRCSSPPPDEEKLQHKGEAPVSGAGVHNVAAKGVASASSPLPNAQRIQSSFGHHDISAVRTQVGGPAEQASSRMGAHAYTLGNTIGFKSQPDLRLAAHEAAHVVQQRRGVHLKDGVGRPGDQYEQQADAVAERVVAGESAEGLLDQGAGAEGATGYGLRATGENKTASAQPGVQAKCDCGTCDACKEEEKEQIPGAVQMDLDVNATRLFEGAAGTAAEGGESEAAGGEEEEGAAGEEGEAAEGEAEGAAEGEGEEASSSEEGAAETSEPPAGDASTDSSSLDDGGMSEAPADESADSSGGGGGGAPASGGASDAGAAPPPGTPATSTAPDGGGGGGGGSGGTTTATAGGGECSGTGAATCYREPSEEPDPEPDEEAPNPPATQTEEETSEGDEEDAPEIDDCPAQAADAGVATADGGTPATSGEGAPATADAAAPAEGAGAEGAPAGGPAPGGAGGGGGGGGTDAAMQSLPSPMEGAIAQAEGQRSAAVAEYGASREAIASASGGTAVLRAGTHFAPPAREESASAALRRSNGAARADRFFAEAADRLDSAIAFAQYSVPDQLGAQAEAAKAQLGASIEAQKSTISARIDAARAQARSDAAMASAAVEEQAASFIAEAEAQTAGAIEAITTAHGENMGQVDEIETTTLDTVNQTYAEGRTELEGLGTTIGGECTTRGEEFAVVYEGFAHCTENGFWDGNLSERRAEAQANAARSTAKGYHDRMIESANKRAREITRDGRKKDRCAVIASAATSRSTLDEQLGKLTEALQASCDAAILQANMARDSLIASINSSLASTLRQLDQQEHDQRQSANDTGYMQQVMQEQVAHGAAASLQRVVVDAVIATQSGLAQAQASFASANPPDPETLDQILNQVMQQVGGALDGMLGSAEGGLALAVEQLASAASSGLSALEGVTQSNDEQATTVSDGFTASMSEIAGTDNFAAQRTGFTQQTEQASSGGIAALAQVVTGMQTGCDGVLEAAAQTLQEAATGLENNLRESKAGLDCQIPRDADEAASKEAPAWKRLVAVLLIIIVIVIVIAVIVASGGAAMAALAAAAGPIGAAMIVGAAVGAVTSGLITIATNLWTNQSWSKGVGKAMLIGAIAGAAGGGLGAAAGIAAKGAHVAIQLGAQMVVAGGVDVVTQYVTGGFSFDNFSWQSLGLTLLITGITFGIGHHMASRGGAPTTEGAPSSGGGTTDAPNVAPTGETPNVSAPSADAPNVSTPPAGETPNVSAPSADAPNVSAPDAPTVSSPDAPEIAPAPSSEAPAPVSGDDGAIVAPEDAPDISTPRDDGAPPPSAPDEAPPASAPDEAPPSSAPDEAPPSSAPDEAPSNAAPDEAPPANAPDDAPDATAPKDEVPPPTSDDPTAPKDPSEMPEPVPDPAPEQKPWEQGRNPSRYQRYKNNLRRRDPTRQPLEPEEWWNQHGSKKPNNPHGGKGNQAHQDTVDALRIEARRQFPEPWYQLSSDVPAPGRSGVGSKPDVAVIDTRTGRVVKVFEAARFNKSGGLIRPDERAKIGAYEADGIPYEFHPVGPNQPPGGVLRSPTPPPTTPETPPPTTPTEPTE